VFAQPTTQQTAAITALEKRGARDTSVTETLTMANTAEAPDPMLVAVKAIDPAVYPFYGEVKLDPPAALRAVLDAGSAAVSDDLLIRLKARVGGTLRLGGQDFRIAAVLVSEPDRLTGSINVGPRVMISRAGLDRTGLISLGSRAAQRYLFLLPPRGSGCAAGAQRVEAGLSRGHDRRLPRDASHHSPAAWSAPPLS
jgi:putative ABC transport system permease protein